MIGGKLKDLLTKENIVVRVNADNWERAVRICGDLLVQNGCVEEEYVESAVQMVEERGAYVVVSPGLAVCYASSDCGVKELGMSLITLEKSVCFGNRYNDPVKIIICLAAVDDISYIKILHLVLKKIHDGSIDKIANARDLDGILKLLH